MYRKLLFLLWFGRMDDTVMARGRPPQFGKVLENIAYECFFVPCSVQVHKGEYMETNRGINLRTVYIKLLQVSSC